MIFFCIPIFAIHSSSRHEKLVECQKEFFAYFNALETHSHPILCFISCPLNEWIAKISKKNLQSTHQVDMKNNVK